MLEYAVVFLIASTVMEVCMFKEIKSLKTIKRGYKHLHYQSLYKESEK